MLVNGHTLKRELRKMYFYEYPDAVLGVWRMNDGKHFNISVVTKDIGASRVLFCDPDEEVFWQDFHDVARALSDALNAAVAENKSPWEVGKDGRVYPKGWRPRWATKLAA